MTMNLLEATERMKPETLGSLKELVRALNDSSTYHLEAAESIKGDQYIPNVLRAIAEERKQICTNISGMITIADSETPESGTFLGSLQKIWTAFRAGMNAGDATIVLIEAERAEDVIIGKFQAVIKGLDESPLKSQLETYYDTVKSGHDRVLALRNVYQSK